MSRKHAQGPRALVRADASSAIGTGHVMRCLALARELRRRGWNLCFAVAPAPGDLRDFVEAEGFRVISPASLEALTTKTYDWLIVDHYGIDATWLREARRFARRILVIDDLADRPLVADVLVDPNVGAGWFKYAGRIRGRSRGLFGPRYAIIRPEFRVAEDELRPIQGDVGRVAITMGGADPHNATAFAVAAVREALPRAEVDVLVGPAFRHVISPEDPRIAIHRNPPSVAEILRRADLVVGAAGTGALERCALGAPSVLLQLADNQVAVAEGLAKAGAAANGGWAHGGDVRDLATLIREVASRPDIRARMRVAGRALVDGWGAQRVANAVDPIRLRTVSWGDAERLLAWANDPLTRSNSLSPDTIPYEKHVAWLRSRLEDPNCDLLIGENGLGPIGHLRLDVRQGVGIVSINVAPEARGGTGASLLAAGLRRWRRKFARLPLRAVIRRENDASRRIFEACGFLPLETRGELIEYELACRASRNPRG